MVVATGRLTILVVRFKLLLELQTLAAEAAQDVGIIRHLVKQVVLVDVYSSCLPQIILGQPQAHQP